MKWVSFPSKLIKDLIDKPQSRIENIMLPPSVIVRNTTASPQKTQEQRAKPAI